MVRPLRYSTSTVSVSQLKIYDADDDDETRAEIALGKVCGFILANIQVIFDNSVG